MASAPSAAGTAGEAGASSARGAAAVPLSAAGAASGSGPARGSAVDVVGAACKALLPPPPSRPRPSGGGTRWISVTLPSLVAACIASLSSLLPILRFLPLARAVERISSINNTHVPVFVCSMAYAIKPSRCFPFSRVLFRFVCPGVTACDWMGTDITVLCGVVFGRMGPVPSQKLSPYSIHISPPIFIVRAAFIAPPPPTGYTRRGGGG